MISSPHGPRLHWFFKSIQSFDAQDYQNKELVIIFNRIDVHTKRKVLQFLEKYQHLAIQTHFFPGRPSLGRLRNFGNQLSKGDLLCVWDDDDLSHPKRLSTQIKYIRGNKSICLLKSCFHLIHSEKKLFWEDFSQYKNSKFPSGLLCTLMFKKKLNLKYPENGPFRNKGEDYYLLQQAKRKFSSSLVYASPRLPLYIYVFHGQNVWDKSHHLESSYWKSVSDEKIAKHRRILASHLKLFQLDLSHIAMHGRSGEITKLEPRKKLS